MKEEAVQISIELFGFLRTHNLAKGITGLEDICFINEEWLKFIDKDRIIKRVQNRKFNACRQFLPERKLLNAFDALVESGIAKSEGVMELNDLKFLKEKDVFEIAMKFEDKSPLQEKFLYSFGIAKKQCLEHFYSIDRKS